MEPFPGFTSAETFTRIPDSFFRLMNDIDDVNELKVTLYVFWRIEHMEGAFRQICQSEIKEDAEFMSQLSAAELSAALDKAVRRGTLLRVRNDSSPERGFGGFYFLNSPLGRASAEALQKGDWRASARTASATPKKRPNTYTLYEENIGPLTPLIADTLKDAEQDYPAKWIADAFRLAVENNKRNWKYVEAILKRWKEEGRDEKQSGRDAEENRGSDVNRKVEDFIKRKR